DLPKGPHEVPLVIFDRLFDEQGQLHYPTSGMPDAPWVPEVYGDALLVNGKLYPYLEVEPRHYRLRVLHASNAPFYYLAFPNGPRFHEIGSDQGLWPAPSEVDKVTLAPAERADLLVDFSAAAGREVVLMSQALPIMQFRVAAGAGAAARPLPSVLRPVAR